MSHIREELMELKKETENLLNEFELDRKEKESLLNKLGITLENLNSFEDSLSPEGKKIFDQKKQELEMTNKYLDHKSNAKSKGSAAKKDWV